MQSRSPFWLAPAMLAIVCSLGVFTGCSDDDDNGGGSSNNSETNPTDGSGPNDTNLTPGGTWVSEVTDLGGIENGTFIGATQWESFIPAYRVPKNRYDYFASIDPDGAGTTDIDKAHYRATRLVLNDPRSTDAIWSAHIDRTSIDSATSPEYMYFDAALNPDFDPDAFPDFGAEPTMLWLWQGDLLFQGPDANLLLVELTRVGNEEYVSGVISRDVDQNNGPDEPLTSDGMLDDLASWSARVEKEDGKWTSRLTGDAYVGGEYTYVVVEKTFHPRPDLTDDTIDSWRFTVTDDAGSMPYFERPNGFVPAYSLILEEGGRLRMTDLRTGNTIPYYFYENGDSLTAGGFTSIEDVSLSNNQNWIRHAHDLLWADDGSAQDGNFGYRFDIAMENGVPASLDYRILTNVDNYHDTAEGPTQIASYTGTLKPLDFFRDALVDRVFLPATATVMDAEADSFTTPAMDEDLDSLAASFGAITRYDSATVSPFALPYNPLSLTAPEEAIEDANMTALDAWLAAGNDADDFTVVAAMPVVETERFVDWDGTIRKVFDETSDGNQDGTSGLKTSDATVDYQVLVAEDLSLRVFDKMATITDSGTNTDPENQATAVVDDMIRYVEHVEVTSSGTGYRLTPDVELETGYGAQITPTFSGSLSSIEITNSGQNYVEPPLVVINGGGGSGAEATAVLGTEGEVVDIQLTDSGTGYTDWPTVLLVKEHAELPGSGANAIATRSVTGFTVDEGGQHYTAGAGVEDNTTTLDIEELEGAPVITSGAITGITISDGGMYSSTPTFTIDPEGDGNASAYTVLTTAITGAYTDNAGTGYASTNTISIPAPVGGGETATATMQVNGSGEVTDVTIVDGGIGYTDADYPLQGTITTDSGTGAVVYLTRSLTDVRIDGEGDDYLNAPNVLIGGQDAEIEAIMTGGSVTGVNVVDAGYNYGTRPVTITVTGASSSTAVITWNDTFSDGMMQVGEFTIEDTGSGYSSTPTLSITEIGTDAVAMADTKMRVGSIDVIDGGASYDGSELVTISGGGGTDAAASLTVSGGVVTGVIIDDAGHGYTSVPTVTIAAPSLDNNDDHFDQVLWAALVGWDGTHFVGANANYGSVGSAGLTVPGPHSPTYPDNIGDGWETMVLNEDTAGALVGVTIMGGNSKADYEAGLMLEPFIQHERYVRTYVEQVDLVDQSLDLLDNLGDYEDIVQLGRWLDDSSTYTTLYSGDETISAQDKADADLWDQTAPGGIRPFGLEENLAGYSKVELMLSGDTLDQ